MALMRLLMIASLPLPLPSLSYKTSRCCCHRSRRLVRSAMPGACQDLSTITPTPRRQSMAQLQRGSVLVGGRELLVRAPPNVNLRPAGAGVADGGAASGAAFLGARAPAASSRHVFSVGNLAR
jgi:hypothetical protein